MKNIAEEILNIIADQCGVDKNAVKSGTNLISEMGIDSIDFLDVTYDLEKLFDIQIPIEAWMEKVNSGEQTLDDFFEIDNFVENIEILINNRTAVA